MINHHRIPIGKTQCRAFGGGTGWDWDGYSLATLGAALIGGYSYCFCRGVSFTDVSFLSYFYCFVDSVVCIGLQIFNWVFPVLSQIDAL